MAANLFSIHIGVNSVDPNHYQGWNGQLNCCENDARYYYQLAEKAGFNSSVLLLNSHKEDALQPTSQNLDRLLDSFSESLVANDLLFITYSGHGGTIPDQNYDEDDCQDETWCLYDRQYLDDELWLHFSRFKAGVRIFLVSDSCHSGSVARATAGDDGGQQQLLRPGFLAREAPRNITYKTYLAHRDVYLEFVKGPVIEKADVQATVMQFGACQDDETAAETEGYGVFTATFKKAFGAGDQVACYRQLFEKIIREMPAGQHPNLLTFGVNARDFLKEQLFR